MRLKIMKSKNTFTAEDLERAFEAQDLLTTSKTLKQKTFDTALIFLSIGLVVTVLNFPLLLSVFFDTVFIDDINLTTKLLYVSLLIALCVVPGCSLLGLHYSSWMHKKTTHARQRIWDQLPEDHKTSWSKYQLLSETEAIKFNTEYNHSLKAR